MTKKRDDAPATKRELADAIAAAIRPLEARIERLEEELLPQRGPGGLGARLDDLATQLAALDADLGTKLVTLDQKYETKITELVRIVAELCDLVARLQASRGAHFRTMEAGG